MKIRDVIKLNKVVKCVKNEKNQILFPTLDPNTIKLPLYTDASFNNLPDGGSQGGHIFLTNFQNKCCPLIWNSSKVKRVVRSTSAAEKLALNEGLQMKRQYICPKYLQKFSIWSTYQSNVSQITNRFMSLTL